MGNKKNPFGGGRSGWGLPIYPLAKPFQHTDVSSFKVESDASSHLEEGQRGAVVPMFMPGDKAGSLSSFIPSSQELRSSLMFVERLDFPENRVVCAGIAPDFESLKKLGVASRCRIEISGKIENSEILAFAGNAFDVLDQREPGRWSMMSPNGHNLLPSHLMTKDRAISLEISNGLPVFSKEVEFEQILDFKFRHWDEIRAFRHHLDMLAVRISHEGVNDISNSIELAQFRSSLAEYINSMNKSNLEKVFASVKANIGIDDVASISGPLLGAMSGHLETGLFSGAVSIGWKIAKGLKRKRPVGPFEFFSIAAREL